MQKVRVYRYILILLIPMAASLHAQNGPLGEWPDFTPIGFITAPHPANPNVQTHLYGDWGGVVGEEFLEIQNGSLKLFYHSYHETYMTTRPHDEYFLDNWELGYDSITHIKHSPLAKPGGPNPGPAWNHTDTPAYIEHPLSGEHLLYNTVRPGTKHLNPNWTGIPGHVGALQVAIRESAPGIGKPFDQDYINILEAEYWWEQGWNNNGVIKGGLSEPTPVWVPHLGESGKVRLFYRGLTGAPGSYWNWRISYADSDDGKSNWEKKGEPVWDPSDPDNPAYLWTLPYPQGFSFRGSWQAHCTGDTIADGVHMVMTVSNQNYAGMGHLAYYWSPDWGDTWHSHPDNPIIAPGQFTNGVPAQGFQRTPAIVVDEDYHRYIIAYNAGHDTQEPWKRRTYVAIASRPVISIDTDIKSTKDQLTVFPNPVSSHINIKGNLTTPVSFDLYSILGEKIMHGYIYAPNQQIDVAHLSPNIYLLTIGDLIVKIVKTK